MDNCEKNVRTVNVELFRCFIVTVLTVNARLPQPCDAEVPYLHLANQLYQQGSHLRLIGTVAGPLHLS